MGKSLEERVLELERKVSKLENKHKKIASGLGIGDTFELVGLEWKILDITDDGYLCLAEKLKEKRFDAETNCWYLSELRSYLNTNLYNLLLAEIGEDNIISFERDLTSLDGQTEYGNCADKVSLLTVDEYRKYRSLIPNTEDYWWWLLAPWSTPCNECERAVTVVSPYGNISNYDGCGNNVGVRTVCIFSSSIFESEE